MAGYGVHLWELNRCSMRLKAVRLLDAAHLANTSDLNRGSARLAGNSTFVSKQRLRSFMAALEHGIPIVSTTPVVPNSDLRDGETLLLAPPGDVPALTPPPPAPSMTRPLRARLGENARHLAAQFSCERIAARSVEAYNLKSGKSKSCTKDS